VNTKQRSEHWDAVYAAKTPDSVTWFQARPENSLLLIQKAGVGPTEPVIDVGGGSSVLVDYLLNQGFSDITVLDVSKPALAHSRHRLGRKAAQINWLVEDLTRFTPQRQYSLWHDRAVFHFLTRAADRQRYITALTAGLGQGGQLIISTFALDGPEKCSGLPVQRYDAAQLSKTLGSGFVLLETFDEVHKTPWGGEQKFAWFRFRRALL
jgi:cyclopropane fatty-acyl-phospholipid synthase-like methyltransferase